MRATVALLVAAVAGLTCRPTVAEDEWTPVPAKITKDTTLGGKLLVASDVRVEFGATLRLLPGTTLRFASDRERTGFDSGLCEIHVHGRLLASGTAGERITTEGERWLGIVLHEKRERGARDSELRHFGLSRAVIGVQVSAGAPTVDHCVFHGCDVGVAAADIRAGRLDTVTPASHPEPRITSSLFVRCGTGVFVERNAAPEVERCTFVSGKVGVGNSGNWGTYPVKGFGARVSRCLFAELSVAVGGSAVVEDSIFVRNSVVHEVSRFHGEFAASRDQIAWRGNVVHRNSQVSRGESDLGHTLRFVDPRLVDEPHVGSLSVDVTPPPGVALAPDSPARGTATDGGDPGPLGEPGLGGEVRYFRTEGRLLESIYVGRASARDLPHRSAVAAGARLQASGVEWARFEPADDGSVSVGPLAPERDLRLYAAFPFEVGDGGEVEIEVNAGGEVGAWLDGRRLRIPKTMRYGSRGVRVPVKLSPGEHELVIGWSPTTPTTRVAAAIHGDGAADLAARTLAGSASKLEVEAVAYRRPDVGFRLLSPVHWADLLDDNRAYVVRENGDRVGLRELAPEFAARGFVKAEVPASWGDEKLELRLNGLRDRHGNTLDGQPLVIPLERR